MPPLANQIHDSPMSLSYLQILNRKSRELGPEMHCEIASATKSLPLAFSSKKPSLILGQPIST
jgi:hypothetical protein